MKKFLRMATILTLICSLSMTVMACGGNTSNASDLEKVTEAGQLVVGMECNYKPFNWTQTDNANDAVKIDGLDYYANGYDVQVAQYIADALEVDLVIKKVADFGTLPELVKTNVIDAVIAGMSPTEERDLTIDFTDEYYNSNLVIVCKVGSALANATTLAEVDVADYTIAAQVGTFHLDALEDQTENCQTKTISDFSVMQEELKAGLIDGYVAEKPTALVFENEEYTYVNLVNNDTGFATEASNTAIAVGVRDSSDLQAKINEILATLTTEMRDEFMANAIAWQNSAVE